MSALAAVLFDVGGVVIDSPLRGIAASAVIRRRRDHGFRVGALVGLELSP